jgi:Ca-activated chloride channel homolog
MLSRTSELPVRPSVCPAPSALLAVLVLALPATLAAQDPTIRCVRAPCPDGRPRPQSVAPIVRSASDAVVRLEGNVWRVTLTERYRNDGRGVGEADYVLPLPRGAAFEDLALTIDGEPVTGEALDAEQARAVYERIVRAAKDPALVEWMGQGLFRTRIFPIAPGEERTVTVRYTVPVRRDGGALRFEHPGGGRAVGAGDGAVTSLTLRLPLDPAQGRPFSPTHHLDLRDLDRHREVRVRGDAARLTLLVPVRSPAQATLLPLLHAPGDEDAYLLLTVTPPAASRAPVARDITLVLDVSGSMQGDKLAQAQAAGRALLATLGPQDRLRLVAFSSDVETFRPGFEPVTPALRQAATAWLDGLRAAGGTNIEAALREALDVTVPGQRLGLVLFLTDGAATVGERSGRQLAAIAAAARGAQRLFTMGIGQDVQAALLEQLALDGRGTAQFLAPQEDLEHAVSALAQRLSAPAATGLTLQASGALTLRQLHPAGPVDLFAGQDLVLLARVRGQGRGTLELRGQGPDGPVRWTQVIDVPARDRAHAYVAKLWAVQRVGWLSAERRRQGPTPELDAELRALGTRYGIPTELSSYLVLEPGMTADGAARPAAIQGKVATAAESFTAARTAATQRAAVSLADVAAPPTAAGSGALRSVGDRSFVQRDGAWVDTRAQDSARRVRIAPYSSGYFALLRALPALGPMLALGDAVTVAGRSVVLEVRADGLTTLDAATLAALLRDW